MKKDTQKDIPLVMNAEKLYKEFNQRFGGYISIRIETVEEYLREVKSPNIIKNINYLYDWVLANDKADEIVE